MTIWFSPRKEIIVVEMTQTQKEENGKGHAIWQECIGTWEVRGQWELRERLRDRWDPGMHHPVPERNFVVKYNDFLGEICHYLKVKNGI